MNDNNSTKGILIVDDEVNYSLMIKETLVIQGYKRVYVAHDGISALSMLSSLEEEIYVIILDIMMPGMDGLQLMRHLNNVHKSIVGIVLATGYASFENQKIFKSLESGTILAAAVQQKPFKIADIVVEVDNAIQLVSTKRNAQTSKQIQQINESMLRIEKQNSDLAAQLEQFEKQFHDVLDHKYSDILQDTFTACKNTEDATRSQFRLVENRLQAIVDDLNRLEKRTPSFIASIGLDVLKTIIIAAFIIASIYFGLGDFLISIIKKAS